MTVWGWLLVIAVVSGWIVFYLWFKRWTRRQLDEADQTTRRKFEAQRSRTAAITSLIVGVVFVVVMLVSWPTVPAGNEPFAIGFLVFGFAFILFGAYKLRGSRE